MAGDFSLILLLMIQSATCLRLLLTKEKLVVFVGVK